MATQASGADTWLTLNESAVIFRRGNENLEAKVLEYESNIFRITSRAPDDLELRIDDEVIMTERYGRWYWRPAGFAGLYQITVSAPGYETKTTFIRVLPSKLSFARYQDMLAEISETSVDLLFQLRSPASEKVAFRTRQYHSSALREYQLIQTMMEQLGSIIDQIRRNPRRVLVEQTEPRLLYEIPRFTGDMIPVPGPVINLPSAARAFLPTATLPEVWLSPHIDLTFDVYENQLLKHFLWRQLLTRISSVSDRAQNEIQRREVDRKIKIQQGWEEDESEEIEALLAVLDDCHDMSARCVSWGSEAFLRSVAWPTTASWPTQVLQKHPAYNRFYQVYMRFQLELVLVLNADRFLTSMTVRKMSELYEIWSVFRVTRMILEILIGQDFQVVSDKGFFEIRDDQFHFEIERQACVELAKGHQSVRVRYEPLYPSVRDGYFGLVSSAVQQRTPDMSVELWENGRAVRVLIFDAKYRTENVGSSQTYRDEDLSKMTDYLHVIRWKDRDPVRSLQKIVSSAYVLYPGDVLEHDPTMPETGALPLVPRTSQITSIESVLRQLLKRAGIS